MAIKDLVGLTEPLKKLIEVVSQGVGTLYEPIHIKRMAKAKAEEIKTITSAINEVNLPVQYSNGQIIIDTSTQEFIQRTERRLLFQETKKQKNIEDIVANAYNNLETEESVSSEPIQEEWTNRFFNIVGEISSDDLKFIWGKVLSEEIKSPGKCSIRTLEVLKNLSRTEAEVFKKIANYIIISKDHYHFNNDVYYLPNEKDILEEVNISYNQILLLDEVLLMKQSSSIALTIKFNETVKTRYLLYNDYFAILENSNVSGEIRLPVYILTKAGQEIFNIINCTTEKEYFIKFLNKIKQKGLKVCYGKIVQKLPDGIEYEKDDMINI